MSLIDLDAVADKITSLLEQEWGYEGICEDIRSVLEGIPTVDAVPVVRCKDCEFALPDGIHNLKCTHWMSNTKFGGFCCYGSRKDVTVDGQSL